MNGQNNAVKILIVDDDEDDFFITGEYIRHIPGNSYIVDWCPKYDDALKHMLDRHYNLYFVDYRLGAKNGVDLLKEALKANCEEPVILLTGKGNYEVDIEAMQLGAVDYLVKTELTTEKMERSIRYAIERASTLKALKENERKYRSIFEKSKDMVFIADDDLNIIDVNEAVYPLLGYTAAEATQMNIPQLIENEGDKRKLSRLLQSDKQVNDWEVELSTKHGEKKICILTLSIEEAYTDEVYLQGIVHDISSLKKIEKANIQAEKLASTGRLVRTLAHEVRNPLNNIMLSVEQILHETKDEDSLVYLNMIHRNSKRINDLITELLNTSRPTEITLEEISIREIMNDVISTAKDSLTLKRIKLETSYPPEIQMIMADKAKLNIALFNIVINAIEAMEEGQGMLTINLKKYNDNMVLTITDNGCGISKENISRLFEPYFTQKRNGMGLGLAFTLNILQAHKAIVEVSSAEKKGTTFTISFPLTKE
jgi:PAS domain S-box-containing protein